MTQRCGEKDREVERGTAGNEERVCVCKTVNSCLPPASGWLTTSLEASIWVGVAQLLFSGHKWPQKNLVE